MLLARLRQETAALHEEFESLLGLASPQLTVKHYGRVLQGFSAFLEPWETAMQSSCPPVYSELWRGRERAHLLRADLRSLQLAGAPAHPQPLELEDAGVWLGSLYVLEGSRLGGRQIAKHVERYFGWQNLVGYRFFASDGAAPGDHWKKLCATLEKQNEAGNQVSEGAHLTFKYLLKVFRNTL